MNRLGMGRFRGYSAGSHPKGQVHPYAIDLLRNQNYITDCSGPKTGKSSRCRTRREWILCSPFVTTPRTRFALSAGAADDGPLGCTRPGRCRG